MGKITGVKGYLRDLIHIPQIRALLWINYLLRKRKPVKVELWEFFGVSIYFENNFQWLTFFQFVWPICMFSALYALQRHYPAVDYDQCMYAQGDMCFPLLIVM